VVGLDVSVPVVEGLTAGRSHVDDLSDADIAAMGAAGFTATRDASVIADAATVVICVPTPLSEDGGPDLGAVLGATASVAAHLRAGTLVVLESTTYPGTTEELLRPQLEAGGLRVGQDVFLAFSPERIDPGNPRFGFRNTPKVVGGVTAECTRRAADFYSRIVDTVVTAAGTREAEMAKLLENTYRHVNIALVNEMLRFCHELDIDLWDVIRCASSKPFGFAPFYPGPGVGGHCIPIDPNYLSYRVQARLGYPFRFVELAQEINEGMPGYVARRVQDLLNDRGRALKGANVLLLGVTYKPDISDQRESPAVPVAAKLAARGGVVSFHDPHVSSWRVDGEELKRVPDLDAALRGCDVAVLLQAHSDYDLDALTAAAPLVLDTRGRAPRTANVEVL
jgi:nucleotide sugar dehydrogenase